MQNLKELISKYATNGPRYTSYPTAPHFSPETDKNLLADYAVRHPSPLSLYIHIPFCKSLCWFCGCTSSVCNDAAQVDAYFALIKAELELWRDNGLSRRALEQIHFGGGTPNFLECEQILQLGEIIRKYFSVSENCEFSAELDPRTLTEDKVKAFAKIGVNRASIGIQDTNRDTQEAIHRIQPQSMNEAAFEWLRGAGIENINCDLIYGLPLQTPKTFAKTVSDALSLSPTRIALFGYAHVPWMKPSQKNLERNPLPNSDEKVEIFLSAKRQFEENGFEFVGLDHFAKPSDPLMQARQNGTLHRNFQGYSTHAGLDTFAVGLTSISETKISYRQNFKSMPAYEKSIKSGIIPIERGIILDGEDILRRGIIMDIMCSLKVSYNRYGVDFKAKFKDAFPHLEAMRDDGLVEMRGDGFEVTKTGRLFLRNIAMLFDARLSDNIRYSKTV